MRSLLRTRTFMVACILLGCSEKPVAPGSDAGDTDAASGADSAVEDTGNTNVPDSGGVDAADPTDVGPGIDAQVSVDSGTQPFDGGFVFPDAGSGTGGQGARCARTADCQSPFVCAAVNANGQLQTQCQPANPGGVVLGGPCVTGAGCASNLCISQRFGQACSQPCSSSAECGAGFECRPETISALGAPPTSLLVCVATGQACQTADDCGAGSHCSFVANANMSGVERVCTTLSGSGGGVFCSSADDCRSRACVNGFCSEPCQDTNDCFATQVCQPAQIQVGAVQGSFNVCQTFQSQACTSNADCTQGGRVCGELRTMAAVTPYCISPNLQGADRGAHCTRDSDCKEGLCLEATNECTVICGVDAHCGAGYVCSHVTYNPGNVDIGFCRRACSDDQDCRVPGSLQNVCTVASDEATNQVNQACSAPQGAGGIGAACNNSNDCQSGFCFTSEVFTGTSCSSPVQCPAGYDCQGGQCHGRFQLCTSVCDNNADCAAGAPFTSCQPVSFTRPLGGSTQINLCGLPD